MITAYKKTFETWHRALKAAAVEEHCILGDDAETYRPFFEKGYSPWATVDLLAKADRRPAGEVGT